MQPSSPFSFFGALLTAITLVSCGGGDGSGVEINPGSDFDPVFSEIQANVFTPTCATSGCHFGAGASQGLRLDEANSFGFLVGVASSQGPTLQLVSAGDPDSSYLIQKLEGTASVGQQMPLAGGSLSQPIINIIRQWIVDGALDDRASSTDPVRVTATSPTPGSLLNTIPADIVVSFDREVDVSTVNPNTFVFEASGGDGFFTDGDEVQITAAAITAGANMKSARFDLSGVVLVDDTYRLRLLGTGPSILMDLEANALDGEFIGAFPSGDGAQGGDFEAVFTVQTGISPAPTLDEIQAQLIGPSCSGCHRGPTSTSLPSGLDLSDADASFANLVGVESLQVMGTALVEPGDADGSYLINKLEGTQVVGGQMPLGGAPIEQAIIDGIRRWIDEGATR